MFLWAALALAACEQGQKEQGQCDSSQQQTSEYLWSAVDKNLFFRWTIPHGQTSVYLRIQVQDVSFGVPPGYDHKKQKNALIDARDTWKKALLGKGVDVQSVTRWESEDPPLSGGMASIVIRYVDSPAQIGGKLGLCGLVSAGGNKIAGAVVYLTVHGLDGKKHSDAAMRAIVTHELGHALGIFGYNGYSGHSADSGDVMFPYSACSWQHLATGDKSSVVTLYNSTPQLTPAGY